MPGPDSTGFGFDVDDQLGDEEIESDGEEVWNCCTGDVGRFAQKAGSVGCLIASVLAPFVWLFLPFQCSFSQTAVVGRCGQETDRCGFLSD